MGPTVHWLSVETSSTQTAQRVMAELKRLFKVDGLVAVISGGGTGLSQCTVKLIMRIHTRHAPGIGLMVAKALAENGASKVYIIGRRLDKPQAAAKESPHGNIIPLQGDVTSKESLDQMANQVKREVGYIHFLVCNSGTAGPTIEKLSPTATLAETRKFMWTWDQKSFNDTYALNDTATFFTVIAFLDLLDAGNRNRDVREGIQSSILITASVAACMRKLATGVAYITSKAAMLQLAKLLSTFFGPHGIRVNALCPGIFPSEMTQGRVGQSSGFSLEGLPAGRAGTEEDTMGTVLWLASHAGAYTNALTVLLEGGRLSQLPATY